VNADSPGIRNQVRINNCVLARICLARCGLFRAHACKVYKKYSSRPLEPSQNPESNYTESERLFSALLQPARHLLRSAPRTQRREREKETRIRELREREDQAENSLVGWKSGLNF